MERAGRVVVRGNKSHRDASTVLRADYALFHKPNIPLAVVEAKDNTHTVGAGMQQALRYAELLDVPFVFRDATLSTGVLEQTLTLDQLPKGNAIGHMAPSTNAQVARLQMLQTHIALKTVSQWVLTTRQPDFSASAFCLVDRLYP